MTHKDDYEERVNLTPRTSDLTTDRRSTTLDLVEPKPHPQYEGLPNPC